METLRSLMHSDTDRTTANHGAVSNVNGFDPELVLQRLLEDLLTGSVLQPSDLDRARRAAKSTDQRLDRVLIDLGLVAEEEIYRRLSVLLDVPFARDDLFPAQCVCPELISKDFARFSKLIPLRTDERDLLIAQVDPFNDEPRRALHFLSGKAVSLALMDEATFGRRFAAIYEANDPGTRDLDGRTDEANEDDVERLRGLASEAPVVKLVNELVSDAVNIDASDIHFEPSFNGLEVRVRVDGRLELLRVVPRGLQAAVTSRLKIMARLDIAERRLPQDGRIKLSLRGLSVDIRVSSVPTAQGECVVLRILDRSRVELSFEKLGFDNDLIVGLNKLARRPNGIVLVTGPTGSGKTTTLYTVLSGIDTATSKAISVEDPVEYQLRGISQIQVQPSIGLTFPSTLRSVLRQDPDVIMIGEIRDAETSHIAMQAALTGHLVLSTLHTNSAVSSITRLLDMGLERFLISSTLEGVLAQRLVRRLCPDCKAPHPDQPRLIDEISVRLDQKLPPLSPRICAPVGCPSCRGSGYRGRISIGELLMMDEYRRRLVSQGAAEQEIETSARENGMVSLFEDGLKKVWSGLSSIDEVVAVAKLDA